MFKMNFHDEFVILENSNGSKREKGITKARYNFQEVESFNLIKVANVGRQYHNKSKGRKVVCNRERGS